MRGSCVGFLLAVVACGDGRPTDSDGSVPRGTRSFGEACADGSDCASGLCIEVEPGRAVCTRGCDADSACPTGDAWGCVSPENWDQRVCGCAAESASEICGDGRDNECNGRADDCRECFGEPVGEDDPRHCGACGNACGPDQACVDGECECTASTRTQCGSLCVDLTEDDRNCGECGFSCDVTEVCEAGACVCPEWAPDECDGRCVDFLDDPGSCGACGNSCEDGLVCRSGSCECPDASREWCDGLGCIDLQSDSANCGSCGNVCGAGLVCNSGSCECSDPSDTRCGDACVATDGDELNCGGCGIECHAAQQCVGGTCSCPFSGELCGDACVRTSSDTNNCGACGVVCAPGERCSLGTCTCASGVYCGDECMPTGDRNNCGGCGVQCNAAQDCTSSGCECTDSLASPCGDTCVRLSTDAANCGACGNACADHLVCRSGSCQCAGSSETDCGAAGCVSTGYDEAHCGGCGIACRTGEICSVGSCRCPYSGQEWCASENGCVDVRNDATHCGACDNACTGGRICSYGSCRCPTGERYCDSVGACIGDSDAHCGACDNACPDQSACNGGTCECFLTTETACATGCTDVSSDVANCGSCGVVCGAGLVCAGGRCLCPAPTGAGPVDYAERSTSEPVFAPLGDGRVAVFYAVDDSRQATARVLVVNADGTPSVAPFDVWQSPYFSSGGAGTNYLMAAVYNGSELGLLWDYQDGGGGARFARVSLSGTVLTPATPIDDDRGAGDTLGDNVNGSVWDETGQLYWSATDGWVALTYDRRPDAGGTMRYSLWSRHLGADASAMAPSRKLWESADWTSNFSAGMWSRMHDQGGGQVRLFGTADEPGSANGDANTAVFALGPTGGPTAPMVSIDLADSSSDFSLGLAVGPDGAEALVVRRSSYYRADYNSGQWLYGPAYDSPRNDTRLFPVPWSARVSSGEAGVVLQSVNDSGAGLRVERLTRVVPGAWEPLDAAFFDPSITTGAFIAVHTGPNSALLMSYDRSYPIQFSSCPP